MSLIVAAASPLRGTEIYSAADCPKAVGAANTTSTITIDTNGRLIIGKIACSFYIPHYWTADLQISLTAPDGTRVYFTHFDVGGMNTATGGPNLANGATTGFGTGAAFAQRVFVDDGAPNRASLHNNFAGAIPPGVYQGYNEDMADFCNKSADGTWTLNVEDGVPAVNPGELVCWSLHIDPIVHRYWTGGGNNLNLSNPLNWRDGVAPLPGEGAAALHFLVPPQPGTMIINDITRLTVAQLEIAGGAYTWMTNLYQGQRYGPYPIAFADQALVSVAAGASFNVLGTVVDIREHNRYMPYNLNNRQTPAGYVDEFPTLSLFMRGLTTFSIADGGTMSFAGMVSDWIYLNDEGSTAILVPRKLGTVNLQGGGRLEFNANVNGGGGYAYGSRYTGTTTIQNGVLYIANNRGLGRLTYIDNNAQVQQVDAGTIVDGGTLELGNIALNISTDVNQINSEESLELRGLGYKNTGALRVMATPLGTPMPITSTVTGVVALGYVTGAVVHEGDDVNPLDPNGVGFGALQGSVLNMNATNFSGDPLAVRIVGGTTTVDATSGLVTALIGGGTVNWQTQVPSHFAVAARTTCNVNRAPLVPEQNVVPSLIPDDSILAVVDGARLNFQQSTVNNNSTTPGGKTGLYAAYRYCETVKSLYMGGGVLSAPDNGIVKILDGTVNTYATTSSQTGPSQIIAHLDLGSAPIFNVAGSDSLCEHLILSYDQNLDYQINTTGTQDTLLCYLDSAGTFQTSQQLITKNGTGTMTLALHSAFHGNAMVNQGGLVVCNTLRNLVNGVVVGNVTVNDGYLGGRGTVGGILVKKGLVAPGRPLIAGSYHYQLPVNQIAVPSLTIPVPQGPAIHSGTLTCDSVNFVSSATGFNVGIYNPTGDCDRLNVEATAGGFVSLGISGVNATLSPIWRTQLAADRSQWFVIIPNGLSGLPVGTFSGQPRLDPSLLPWICYSFNPYVDPVSNIQPDPQSPAFAAFATKMTNGTSVAIRVNGVVNFHPYPVVTDPTAIPSTTYTVPEVNVADGSAVKVPLQLDASGPGQVSYATADGTAVASVDYVPGTGQVTAPGAGPTISIIYNQTIDQTRSFNVNLMAPTNGLALGQPATATVVITDVNAIEDEKKSGCGLSSGFAVFFLLIAGLGRLVVLRRRRD